jgi:DNA-binding phage protein
MIPKSKRRGSSRGRPPLALLRGDPAVANALLQEAAQALLDGETTVARTLIRDVIKGAIGYAELSRRTGTPQTSLVRMFGPSGNPTIGNVCNVLAALQAKNRLRFTVRLAAKPRRVQRSRRARVRN